MAILISLGRQRLPFIKSAAVIDIDVDTAQEHLDIIRQHKIFVTKFACYTNKKYKYVWAVYKYIGKERNLALALDEIQNKLMLCGHEDYLIESEKMITSLIESIPNIQIREIKD